MLNPKLKGAQSNIPKPLEVLTGGVVHGSELAHHMLLTRPGGNTETESRCSGRFIEI